MTVAERLQSRIFSGMDSADAWNEVSVDLVRCAKVNACRHIEFNEVVVLKEGHVVKGYASRIIQNYYFLRFSMKERLGISDVRCVGCDGKRRADPDCFPLVFS